LRVENESSSTTSLAVVFCYAPLDPEIPCASGERSFIASAEGAAKVDPIFTKRELQSCLFKFKPNPQFSLNIFSLQVKTTLIFPYGGAGSC